MEKKIRLGIIGCGNRGRGILTEAIAPVESIEITALCDILPDRVQMALDGLKEKNYPVVPWTTSDHHELLDPSKFDVVVVATSWNEHIELAIECMNAGVPVAMEVGGAPSLDLCWELVKTYERTKTPCFMLENCCFNRFELAVLNMIRQGLFGEIAHCEGGYHHYIAPVFVEKIHHGPKRFHQRSHHNMHRDCDLYPTHDAGPISKYLDINYGNRYLTLTSFSSHSISMNALSGRAYGDGVAPFRCGDHTISLLTCANGQTVALSHDVMLPRPASRGNVVHGTKGICMEINKSIHIAGVSPDHEWESIEPYLDKYDHPMWKAYQERGVSGGHGGMDGLEFEALAYCLMNDVPYPIDVYDCATWMAITALSEDSIARGGHPVPFPDFTNGKWISRKPVTGHPFCI